MRLKNIQQIFIKMKYHAHSGFFHGQCEKLGVFHGHEEWWKVFFVFKQRRERVFIIMPNNSNHSAAAATDGVSEDVRLGRAIRDRRKELGLTLTYISDEAGISAGLLSQIERGLSSPSVRVLRSISGALRLSVLQLFSVDENEAADDESYIVRANHRRSIDLSSKGVLKSFLTAHDEGELQVMDLDLEPGGGSGDEPYSHAGEECGVVIEGCLEISIDGRPHILNQGDSFHFESSLPHRYRNLGEGKCRVIWATTPPIW